MKPKHSLRHTLFFAFAGSALAIGLLFSLCTFLFAYVVEDRYFEAQLKDEAALAEQQLTLKQRPQPRLDFIRYLPAQADLPAQVQASLLQNPELTEFALTNGRHLHMQALSQGYLVADVSEHLIVREIRPLMFRFLGLLLLMVLGLTALLAWLVSLKVLTPLQRLHQLVPKEPDQPFPEDLPSRFAANEIGELANALQQSWQRSLAFLQREQQFTRDLSHELRTPISISQGALELLQLSQPTAQQQPLLSRLQQAQQQSEQSIQSLLELMREQAPAPGHSLLLPLVERSILQQHYKLAHKQIELKLAIAADAQVPVAEAPLLILLNNLLGNAFSYTHQGQISISYQQQVLSVCDTGQGITPELQPQVFTAGEKGQNSEGMGMGLSIVQRLCQKWQLQCTLQSSATGTSVSIGFP